MINATQFDRSLITQILSQSFKNNKSVNYIIAQGENSTRHLQSLMEYSFDVCMKFGEVFLSADKCSCALILYPEKKRTDLESIWLDVKLIFNAVGISNIFKALKREGLIKKSQKTYKATYLWFIGVSPDYQHQGIGSELLKEVLAYSRKQGRNILLETSTLENLPWYAKFDFRVYHQHDFGFPFYFLEKTF